MGAQMKGNYLSESELRKLRLDDLLQDCKNVQKYSSKFLIKRNEFLKKNSPEHVHLFELLITVTNPRLGVDKKSHFLNQMNFYILRFSKIRDYLMKI